MDVLNTLVTIITLFAIVTASPICNTRAIGQLDLSTTPIVYSSDVLSPIIIEEFPVGTWVENLVVRQKDGNAVTTILSAPEVYLVSTTKEFEPVLLATFPGNLGVLGIVELGHDVFYVAVGNWSAHLAQATPGSWSIWEIDLNGWNMHEYSAPTTKKIADLTEAGFLNGMTILNRNVGTILVADSLYSAIWRVNVHSGQVNVAINDTTMETTPERASLALGINAISIEGGYLYYDNTNAATFNRIPIDVLTGEATGSAEILVDNVFPTMIFDDFSLDFAGNAWVVSGRGELILLQDIASGLTPNINVVAGSTADIRVTGHTAAKFGSSKIDLERGSLYATTSGGAVGYIFGNLTAGGMLVRYDTIGLGVY